MEANDFIKKFIEQIEDHDGSEILMETEFRQLNTWDSLTGVAVQIMIHDSYNSAIPDSEFKSTKTLGELYNLAVKYQK